ncbi:type II/IV secretion system protein [Candidatus Daviesbacteria bacterium]|nr:type II/IV secretion system protein [Candidatus Daviesbacteria bacterium]
MDESQLTTVDVLEKEGKLTPEQVSTIKLENINTGTPPEKIILDRNFATEKDIAMARAKILGIPYLELEDLERPGISPEVLNMVPEQVARRYKLIPFKLSGNILSIAMADPLDIQVIQFIEKKTGRKTSRFLALEKEIVNAISDQYSQNLTSEVVSALNEVSSVSTREEKASSDFDRTEVIKEAPVTNIVTQLLDYAVKTKASDIHVEPEETQTRVRYRIDGILHEKIILPKKVHEAVASRIKIMSGLKIDERRLPQDGRFTFSDTGIDIDLRVSTLPTIFGEKIVLRLLPKSQKPPTLLELGLRASALKSLDMQLTRTHGIILICGPTGSGKTTTLYSILSRLSSSKVNILTVEDPVEYHIEGANQVQVNPQIGLTFASALRSFLRQDPNIILVGEVRDAETAELAIQAALTGHQVFSTLHTNSAAGSLPRLLDMGMEPFLLASSVNAVQGQRILRKLCQNCRYTYSPPQEVEANITQVLGNLTPAGRPIQLYKAKGCSECGGLGFSGRIGIFEVLVVSDKIMRLTLERASATDIEKQAVSEGMMTLKQDGYLKVLEGVTTMEEVLRVAQD